MANSGITTPVLLLACIGIIAITLLIPPIAGSRWDNNGNATGQGNMTGNLTAMKPFMGHCPVNSTCMVMEPDYAVCPANDNCVKYNCQTLEGSCIGTNKTTGKTCYKAVSV